MATSNRDGIELPGRDGTKTTQQVSETSTLNGRTALSDHHPRVLTANTLQQDFTTTRLERFSFLCTYTPLKLDCSSLGGLLVLAIVFETGSSRQ